MSPAQPGIIASGNSGFNPLTAISWHVAAWASDPLWTPPADGGTITSIHDGSGNGRTINQTKGSNPVIYRASVAGYNNKPAIELNTSSCDIGTAGFTEIPQPFSIVVVGNLGTASASYCALAYARGNNSAPFTLMGRVSSANFGMFHGSQLNGTVSADTSPHFFAAVFNGASSKIIVGSTTATGAVDVTNGANALFMNSNSDGSSNPGGGRRAFVGMYAADISAHGSWADFKAWVASYYGVTT